MRRNRLLTAGATLVLALSAGAVTASVLQDAPRDARPVQQDPIGEILRNTPATPAVPTETAPSGTPAPRAPIAVSPPPSVQIAEDAAVAEKAEEEVEVTYEGEEIEIGFNVNYLMDALAAIDGPEVQIGLTDGNSSCLIRSAQDGSARYVVMPMRL